MPLTVRHVSLTTEHIPSPDVRLGDAARERAKSVADLRQSQMYVLDSGMLAAVICGDICHAEVCHCDSWSNRTLRETSQVVRACFLGGG